MPDDLTRRTTVVLVAIAFGLTFAIRSVGVADRDGDRPSLAGHLAQTDRWRFDPRLAAAAPVPALREPREPRKRKPRRRPPSRASNPVVPGAVTPAPTAAPPAVEPTATVNPVPTPVPRRVPPPPARTRNPAPAPTAAPPAAGEFDTTGE